jgi:hypothetical protein
MRSHRFESVVVGDGLALTNMFLPKQSSQLALSLRDPGAEEATATETANRTPKTLTPTRGS